MRNLRLFSFNQKPTIKIKIQEKLDKMNNDDDSSQRFKQPKTIKSTNT